MSHNLETVAHSEIGKAYETAVSVSLFTWRMFYIRCVAVFTAAGYLAFKPEYTEFAIGLLFVSGLMTLVVTTKQLHDNQRVIQKVLAAGFLTEIRNNGLGCRFVHEIHVAGDHKSTSLNKWSAKRAELIEKYRRKSADNAFVHAWVEPAAWEFFGIYPNLLVFAIVYGGTHFLFILAIILR